MIYTFKIDDFVTTIEISTDDAELLERLSTAVMAELEYDPEEEESE